MWLHATTAKQMQMSDLCNKLDRKDVRLVTTQEEHNHGEVGEGHGEDVKML